MTKLNLVTLLEVIKGDIFMLIIAIGIIAIGVFLGLLFWTIFKKTLKVVLVIWFALFIIGIISALVWVY